MKLVTVKLFLVLFYLHLISEAKIVNSTLNINDIEEACDYIKYTTRFDNISADDELFGKQTQHQEFESAHRKEDRMLADKLTKEIRVLCMIMIEPKYHKIRGVHIKETWGKRCNKILFMSTETDDTLPAIGLPVKPGAGFLWRKTKAAFTYVYNTHYNDFDWFMKVDDSTYVIVENLRFLLSSYRPTEPIYFGHRYKKFTPQGFTSGAAGVVISWMGVSRLVTQAFLGQGKCAATDDGDEDVQLGICLSNVGVRAMDSRDALGRERFLPFAPGTHMHLTFSRDRQWYWEFALYPLRPGMDCCSDYAITFHHISPKVMYVLDYLVYHLRPHGVKVNYTAIDAYNYNERHLEKYFS